MSYTQLQKKVYTFRSVEYSDGSGPEMNHISPNQIWISRDHFHVEFRSVAIGIRSTIGSYQRWKSAVEHTYFWS